MDTDIDPPDVDLAVRAAFDEVYRKGFVAGELAGYARGVEEARCTLNNLPSTPTSPRILPVPSGERLPLGTTIEDLMFYYEDLRFRSRAYSLMKSVKINTLGELVECSEDDLLDIRGFGQKSLRDIKAVLKEAGYTLSPERRNAPLAR